VSANMKMVQSRDQSVVWGNHIGIKSELRSNDLFGSLASMSSAISDNEDDDINWITIQRQTSGDGSALGNLLSGLVEQAIGNMTDTLLAEETLALINHSTRTLRNGPGI